MTFFDTSQLHSFWSETECDNHDIRESFCEFVSTFNHLTSFYETWNEGEAIENYTLAHLFPMVMRTSDVERRQRHLTTDGKIFKVLFV